MFPPHEPDRDELANSVAVVDRNDVQVAALKPAFRGDGVVVRLASFADMPIDATVSCPSRPGRTVTLCDARERDLKGLEVRAGLVVVPMPLAIASVLVRF